MSDPEGLTLKISQKICIFTSVMFLRMQPTRVLSTTQATCSSATDLMEEKKTFF